MYQNFLLHLKSVGQIRVIRIFIYLFVNGTRFVNQQSRWKDILERGEAMTRAPPFGCSIQFSLDPLRRHPDTL